MRAAVYRGDGRLVVEERPRPTIAPGELLVRVRACGLCGSDLMRWYQDPRAPMVMGHEPAGEVVEAGEGAHQPVGSRVFLHHHVPCMVCERCRAGRHTLCGTFRETALDPGGLAEYVRVPAPNAALDTLELPDHVDDVAATLIEPLGCILRGQRQAGVGPGRTVAVVGAGSMGLLEIVAARALGASAVLAVEPRPDRREIAAAMGAEVTDRLERDAVAEAVGADGADAVFVCTSHRQAIADSLHLAAPGGVVQLFAPTPPGELVGLDLGAIFFREVSLQSTYSAGPYDTREALDLLAAGAVDLDTVVTHRLPLERVQEAYDLAGSGRATKVVVEL